MDVLVGVMFIFRVWGRFSNFILLDFEFLLLLGGDRFVDFVLRGIGDGIVDV